MSISKDKERIAISLSKDKLKEFDAAAKEMGFSKSTLIQIATEQYINTYRQYKEAASNFVYLHKEVQK